MMWHNIDFTLLEILGDLVPHLRARIDAQSLEIKRVLREAASGVIVDRPEGLVWRHIDSDDTVLCEGDTLRVTRFGELFCLIRERKDS